MRPYGDFRSNARLFVIICCVLFRKIRRLRLLLPVAVLALNGCRTAPQTASSSTQNAATPEAAAMPRDDLNREIKLAAPAARVAIIGPGAIESAFAMGAGAHIIGRDAYADFPPPAQNAAVMGDFNGPSVEKTIALRPDLVIVQGETYDRERIEKWQQQIGAPVAQLSATTLKGVAADIRKIGAGLGESENAEAVATRLQGTPRPLAVEANAPTAFFEVGRSPLYTAGSDTLVGEILTAANLKNVATTIKGYKAFNGETLLAQQPDVYVVTSEKPDAEQTLRTLKAHPVLKNLRCVQNGHVVILNASEALRPGPRLRDAIEQLKNDCQKMKLYR